MARARRDVGQPVRRRGGFLRGQEDDRETKPNEECDRREDASVPEDQVRPEQRERDREADDGKGGERHVRGRLDGPAPLKVLTPEVGGRSSGACALRGLPEGSKG